jgi:hypothetical protein
MANTGSRIKDESPGITGSLGEKATEAGSQLADKARQAAQQVGRTVGNAASSVGQTAENLASGAGSQVRHLGDTIGENAPHEGVVGSAAQGVASAMRSSGRYLEEQGLSGMMGDVLQVVRNNPIPALIVGVGIGFVLGRLLSSSD